MPNSNLAANVETMSVQLYSNKLGQTTGRNNAQALDVIYLRTNLQTLELEYVGNNLDDVQPQYDYKYSYKAFINTTEMVYSWKKVTSGYAILTTRTLLPLVE